MEKKTSAKMNVIRLVSIILMMAVLITCFTTAEAKTIKTVKVSATAGWVNTGISISAGQKVTIQAKGVASTLKTSKKSKSGPNGQRKTSCGSTPAAPPPCALNYAPYGALVGKIGNGAAFVVGKKSTFIAQSTGILYLAVNDNLIYYNDNQGGYTVIINMP